jgi:NAD(P)-dependent dehydrogenase (short-subunit alcohol dehydrogenase family)
MKTTYSLFSVQNNVICISGSSRELGKTIGYAFAEAGAKVVLSSNNEEELRQTVQEFNAQNLICESMVASI